MQSILGFLLVNIYAFLIIVTIAIIFYTKKRLRKTEDNLYELFLIDNIFMSISGIVLGLLVDPRFLSNIFIISLANKVYLVSLLLWIVILTYYILYVSLKKQDNIEKYQKIFLTITIVSICIILFFPLDVTITEAGSAVSTGIPILLAYSIFGIGFLMQIICVLLNYKNIKNKKYIPVYVLVFLGTIILSVQIINPNLNYLINPVLIFIAFIMFHTIENPDAKVIEELNSNKKLIEKTNEDKLNLLFELSQDVKQPIQSIENEVLELENVDSLELVGEKAKKIKASSKQLSLISNNILNVSNMDLSNIKIENEVYKPDSVFTEMKKRTEEKLKDKDIEFRYIYSSSIPEKLYGDSVKLKQILTSFLNNAVEVTKKGFIELKINSIIKYDVCRLIITITDSGIGMDIDKVNEILSSNTYDEKDFEVLKNLDVGTKMAHKIIKMLNGTLIVKSEVNKGSEFLIIIDQKIKEEQKIEDKEDKYLRKSKILVVNDKLNELKKIENKLVGMGYDVTTTLYGKDAVEKIKNKEGYNLIIIDDEMNLKSGYDTLKELKKNKKFNTPVIITLEENKKFLKDKYLEDGFNDYIMKDNLDEELKKVAKYI